MISWAYEFHCGKSLYEMEKALNEAGPWEWMVRDCDWYPDYLHCRPQSGTRVCIYAVKPPGPEAGYRCLAEGEAREGADSVLRDYLGRLGVEGLREIEASEWPFD